MNQRSVSGFSTYSTVFVNRSMRDILQHGQGDLHTIFQMRGRVLRGDFAGELVAHDILWRIQEAIFDNQGGNQA